jgi:hypothetical protein
MLPARGAASMPASVRRWQTASLSPGVTSTDDDDRRPLTGAGGADKAVAAVVEYPISWSASAWSWPAIASMSCARRYSRPDAPGLHPRCSAPSRVSGRIRRSPGATASDGRADRRHDAGRRAFDLRLRDPQSVRTARKMRAAGLYRLTIDHRYGRTDSLSLADVGETHRRTAQWR